ncbi:MAG: response regulator [Xenococcaceae cyanobacterium MO_207.B15]|nr:response regulator [Xenococcaceae cyanobacterium MO_207.B15]MDJ0743904.1 response regulator [Xenococcaceae cyanobacterium MO_167.B27]
MGKVLLVEDSLVDIQVLTNYLENQGLIVQGVSSGEEAQLRLKRSKPDLIVLDVILPGLSGFELCRKLKADPTTQGIPIVLCSTKNTEVDKTWGKMSGADAYLTKPIDEAQLKETVGQLIK